MSAQLVDLQATGTDTNVEVIPADAPNNDGDAQEDMVIRKLEAVRQWSPAWVRKYKQAIPLKLAQDPELTLESTYGWLDSSMPCTSGS